MRDRLEITAPRSRSAKMHIIIPGLKKPHCGQHMTAITKIISYDELIALDKKHRVCGTCMSKELQGGF